MRSVSFCFLPCSLLRICKQRWESDNMEARHGDSDPMDVTKCWAVLACCQRGGTPLFLFCAHFYVSFSRGLLTIDMDYMTVFPVRVAMLSTFNLCAIFSFAPLARVLVSEKEGRMKEALRMMGLPDLIYHGSWLITFQAQVGNRTL